MRTEAFDTVMAGCESGDDLTDRAFSRALFRGIVIGAPVVFVVVTGIALLALGWHAIGLAAAIAVWPAVLGGAFYGGLALMIPVAEACHPVSGRRAVGATVVERRRAA